MISNFYPGPSKLHTAVQTWLQDAYESGILSSNHRSELFMKMYEETIDLLKLRLEIPQDYLVFTLSSATECWELIAQSIIAEKSLHIYNGAFGEKWKEATEKLGILTESIIFDCNDNFPNDIVVHNADTICITHNETSNGTALPASVFNTLQQKALIAVDATSSMAGTALPFSQADIWFASVQKCFGLPSGLCLVALSPRAVRQGILVDKDIHYNSLKAIIRNSEKQQTTHTPNILGIYLLNRWAKTFVDLTSTYDKTNHRAEQLYLFFENSHFAPLISNIAQRSATVITLSCDPEQLSDIIKKTKEHNIILGKGYGKWKNNSFRIANFPAITDDEINQLTHFFKATSWL